MKPEFTLEQFLEVFKTYNEGVFPMQILLYLVGITAVFSAMKPGAHSPKIVSSILAFFWLWMGIVYHLVYFTRINPLAYAFGAFFIIQGILFVVLGIFQNAFSFTFRADTNGITGVVLIAFALIIYPVTGYFLGHFYPSSPTFGLPCPTTIFTFGILLLNEKKCPPLILIIPFVWSAIGFMAAFQFGIWEDTGLIAASVISVSLLIYRNKILQKIRIKPITQ